MRLASLEYTAHVFQLTQEDRHAMWHDEAHLPTPKTHTSTNFAFEIEESLKLVCVVFPWQHSIFEILNNFTAISSSCRTIDAFL